MIKGQEALRFDYLIRSHNSYSCRTGWSSFHWHFKVARWSEPQNQPCVEDPSLAHVLRLTSIAHEVRSWLASRYSFVRRYV